MKKPTDPMDASSQCCPNLECKARGQVGQGNLVIHGRKRPRYRCKTCGRTFSAKEGTLFAGLRKPTELIVMVVTLLAYGCPVQAIVHAFGLDERTVAAWRDRAGAHCQRVHEAIITQASLDLIHVQADDIRVKGRAMVVRRVVEVTRKMTWGTLEQACALVQQSQGGSVLNTAFIERLNDTLRERLATLTRKCRPAACRLNTVETGMYLIGCTYNFCFVHHELSKAKQTGYPCTPAMAAGLTNHVWSIFELFCYRVAPSPWVPLKRRGRSRKQAMADPSLPKRPRGRPRIKPLPDPSQPKRPPGRPRKLALVPSTG